MKERACCAAARGTVPQSSVAPHRAHSAEKQTPCVAGKSGSAWRWRHLRFLSRPETGKLRALREARFARNVAREKEAAQPVAAEVPAAEPPVKAEKAASAKPAAAKKAGKKKTPVKTKKKTAKAKKAGP